MKFRLDAYGVTQKETAQFGRNFLLVRRTVERGVRFVQIVHVSRDHQAELAKGIERESLATDKPSTALVSDFRQRGSGDSALVVCGGDFGWTPMVEDRTPSSKAIGARDHHRLAFNMWLAPGGIRPECALGHIDGLGLEVAGVRSP